MNSFSLTVTENLFKVDIFLFYTHIISSLLFIYLLLFFFHFWFEICCMRKLTWCRIFKIIVGILVDDNTMYKHLYALDTLTYDLHIILLSHMRHTWYNHYSWCCWVFFYIIYLFYYISFLVLIFFSSICTLMY